MTAIDRRYSVAEGTAIKAPCRVATTANITLSGEQTIDGVAVVAQDRVLVQSQTNAVDNGIYDCSTGNWTRARDFDGAYDVVRGTRVLVTAGSTHAYADFVLLTADPITIGTSSITFLPLTSLILPASLVAIEPLGSIANNRAVGNVSGAAAPAAALTATQLTTLVNPFTSLLSGAVPASAGGVIKYLRADVGFYRPPGNSVTGSRCNFTLVMTNRTSATVMEITNCAEILLTPNADQVNAGLNDSTANLRLVGFSTTTLATLESAGGDRARCDITSSGVSSKFAPGGLDTGVIAPSKDYYLWIVSDGQSLTNTGLVWSLRNDVPVVDYNTYTYFARIGWNFSNAAGTGFKHALFRWQYRTYYVGGTGANGALPVLASGLASQWTSLGIAGLNVLAGAVSPDAGSIGLHIKNATANSVVAVAPNEFWGSVPLAYVSNPPGVANDIGILADVMSDSGGPSYWSTSASGSVSLAYFEDSF